MSLHDIHSCSKICSENTELKRRLAYMKKKQDEVQRQLKVMEKERCVDNKCSKPAKKVAAVQTDLKPWAFHHHRPEAKFKEGTQADINKINKVLEMHSQLLKRYDKEVKLNMTYADTISDLNVQLAETDKQLREEKEKSVQLERELVCAREKMRKSARVEDPVLRDVVQERNKLSKENQKLKEELRSLDHNFFDELEDLKYALLQSARLNAEYEKSMKKLCAQFGLPFTVPGRVLNKTKT